MPEIQEFTPYATTAHVNGNCVIGMYSPVSGRSSGTLRSVFLHDVAFEGGDHNFGTSEIQDLTVTEATIASVTIETSVKIGGEGAELSKMRVGSKAVTLGSIAAGAGQTDTINVTGAAVSDMVLTSVLAQLPDGLTVQAWVSSADEVSVRFYNCSNSSIPGATYTVAALVLSATNSS